MIWVLAFIVAALIAGPFIWEALRKPVDTIIQAEAPGSFADLTEGATHY